MAVPLLILDLDGTLVDSFSDIRYGLGHALAAIDVQPTPELLDLSRRGMSLEACFEHATGRSAAEPGQREQLDAFVTAYRSNYFSNPEPGRAYEGVADTLAEIRATCPGTTIAVATTKRTRMARDLVDRCGLTPLIDHVQGSDGLPNKPDPALLRVVATEVGTTLAGAMMVGDTDKDLGAARAAGCIAVAVTYGGWTREELEPLRPDALIDAFPEIFPLVTALGAPNEE